MTRFLMTVVFVAVATSVEAHALLVRTAPPKRAVLRDPPRQIELWFNERLEPSFAALTVLDNGGAQVSEAKAHVAADDRKRLTLELPELPPGNYTVRFRVLSVDGHIAEDSFRFSVR
jgi:methionine-rich copper-binding protein CopC